VLEVVELGDDTLDVTPSWQIARASALEGRWIDLIICQRKEGDQWSMAGVLGRQLLPSTSDAWRNPSQQSHPYWKTKAANEWKMIKNDLLQKLMANGQHLLPYVGPKLEEKAGGRHELHRYM
jgi:hypothetical protein